MGRRKTKRRRTTYERMKRRILNEDFEAEVKAYFLTEVSYFSRPTVPWYYFVQDPSPYQMSHSQLTYYVSYCLKLKAKENDSI
jgi:hypothetical protein